MPSITPSPADTWPRSLDDLRREPGRIVTPADLARLGIVGSYDGLRRLPPSLRLPGRRKGWEGRTILACLNAPMTLPDGAAEQAAA